MVLYRPKHRPKGKLRVCRACNGAGEIWNAGKAEECRRCKGTGQARKK